MNSDESKNYVACLERISQLESENLNLQNQNIEREGKIYELAPQAAALDMVKQELSDWMEPEGDPIYAARRALAEISRLESSLAELQRVVQVKDEAIQECIKTDLDYKQASNVTAFILHDKAHKKLKAVMSLTPKDLPKFVPEEEYLRVKDERDELKDWKEAALSVMPDYQGLGGLLGMKLGESVNTNLIPRIALLKSHAEAMAQAIATHGEHEGLICCPICILDAYRKDFPK